MPVTVAADNSPFTIYEFLANNLSNNTIKLNEVSVPTLIVNGNNRAASSIGPSLSDLASLVAGGGASSSSIMAFGDLFLQDSISSACRWLSMFGWPRGRKAISSPTDLRQEVQRGRGHTNTLSYHSPPHPVTYWSSLLHPSRKVWGNPQGSSNAPVSTSP